MSNSLDRLVSIKNTLKYVSGFTTYNYKDDSDYGELQCGGEGVVGDITVVELGETNPVPTLLSRSVSKSFQHVFCLIQTLLYSDVK